DDALGDMRLEEEPLRTYLGYVKPPDEEAYLTVVSLFAEDRIDVRLIRGACAAGAAILLLDWNGSGAGRELALAAALDPRSARAHTRLSEYLSAIGGHDEALAHARTAGAIVPRLPRP